jgi:hypothetical protein
MLWPGEINKEWKHTLQVRLFCVTVKDANSRAHVLHLFPVVSHRILLFL